MRLRFLLSRAAFVQPCAAHARAPPPASAWKAPSMNKGGDDMLRKALPMLAVGVVAGIIIASMSIASAQTGSETITVVAKTVKFKAVDLGTTGQSPGDLVVIKN